MPDPGRLLKTIANAVAATQRQPGRHGRLVDLVDVEDILVAGDLHGHLGNFQAVYKLADLGGHPKRHLVLQEVLHGKYRYPSGGDKSHQILDLFCALKNQYPDRVHLLMGNHELAQWTGRPIIKAEEDLNRLFTDGLSEAYGSRFGEIEAAYNSLFDCLPLALRTPNRIFLSHSLPTEKNRPLLSLELLRQPVHRPEDFAPRGPLYSLLWGRDCSAANTAEFLKLVDCDFLVSGHIPCDHGFATPNAQQVIIDSCSSPAACMLLPADRPLTRHTFYACVRLL